MDVSRRGFLKLTGTTLLVGGLGIDLKPIETFAQPKKIKYTKETTTICPYCAVGCGIIVHSRNGKIINAEGDPDHPINEGTLCSKGASVYQLSGDANENRLKKPLYREPYAKEFKEISWDEAIDKIAKNVKKSRDKGFVIKNAKGQVVNRNDDIAHIGSAALDNEECYILQKLMRGLGLVYIEHQARI